MKDQTTGYFPINHGPELRRTQRSHRCEALLWGYAPDEQAEIGWLLESSDEGFAFVWRGVAPPKTGEVLHAHLDGLPGDRVARVAIVRRTQRVHDDLVLVACQCVLEPVERAHAEVKIDRERFEVRTRRVIPSRRVAV
ncbi:MAG: hypothetical protein Tsb0013_06430 [Phycisphaerales bacterium]